MTICAFKKQLFHLFKNNYLLLFVIQTEPSTYSHFAMKNAIYSALIFMMMMPAHILFAQSDTPSDEPEEYYELSEYQKERTIAMAEEHDNVALLNVYEALTAIKYPGPVSLSTSENHPQPLSFEKSEGLEKIPDYSNLRSKKHKNKVDGFFSFLGDLSVGVSSEATCNNGRVNLGY